jgi:hypothetical protein
MKSDKSLEEDISQHLRYSGRAAAKERILGRAHKELTALNASAPNGWCHRRKIMQSRLFRYTSAAAVLAIVVGGLTLFPFNRNEQSPFALSAAFGQQAMEALEAVKGVTCRERHMSVTDQGQEHISSTWDIFYVSQDSYRRDIYDGNDLREIQWYTPDVNGTAFTSIRFDLESYFSHVGPGSFGQRDPVERIRFYLRYVDDPDQILEDRIIEEQQCIGFAVKASRYGTNPEEWVDCIWFDVETKLPVLIEKRGRSVSGSPFESRTMIQDQFDYNPQLEGDTFVPLIPEGFVFGHPDDLKN